MDMEGADNSENSAVGAERSGAPVIDADCEGERHGQAGEERMMSDDATSTIQTTVVSKLHLVDLAGSERSKKTMTHGTTMGEGN